MSRTLSLLVLLVAVTGTGQARGTTGILEGRVRDKATHQPIPGVTVMVDGTGTGATSDIDGRFRVSNIRAGVYSVRCVLVGYRRVVVTNVSILPDLRTTLDIEMESSAVEMDAVEIRGERPLIQRDQAATAYSLGEFQIEKLPITQFSEALNLQPGVTREGNVRGGRTDEVVYLVDGLPVQDVLSGGLGASLPKAAITGMTVWTGGFDAEYGNVLSGVVSVVTKGGTNEQKFGVRYERDQWLSDRIIQQTDHEQEAEVSASGPVVRDQLFYYLTNVYSSSDTRWWQDMTLAFGSPIRSEWSGFAKLEYIPAAETRIGLQLIYALQKWRDYEFSWRYNLVGLPARTKNAMRAALQATHTFSPHTYASLSLSLYGSESRMGDSKSGLTLLPYEYDLYLRYVLQGSRNWWQDAVQWTGTVKGDVTTESDIHLLKAGFEITQYNLTSDLVKYEPQTTYFGKPIPGAAMLNYSSSFHYLPRAGGVFIQDKMQVVEDGSIFTAGVRWDFLDPTASRPLLEYLPGTLPGEYQQHVTGWTRASMKQQVSLRVSFTGPVGPSSYLFVNLGQYFQYPLFDQLYSGLTPAQVRQGVRNVLTGNPDLDPERLTAWEIGLKHAVDADVVLSATFFTKQTKNQVDTKTLVPFDSKFAGDYGFAMYVNNAYASSTGIEFMLSRQQGTGIHGTVSYTYMTTEGVSDYADQNINRAQWGFAMAAEPYPLSWDQRHTLKADVDLILPMDIHTNVIVVANSARPYTYYPTRDGFTPVDASLPFTPNNARMRGVVTIDMKLTRRMQLGGEGGPALTIYADIRNLLNTQNVRWMDSNGRVGGELGDPSAFYDLRRVRAGIRMEF